MNKQEAIKKIDRTLSLPRPIGSFPYDYEDGFRYAKHIINQIDVPEKPVIPQFVADWIEVCKEHLTTSLYTAMNPNFMKGNSQSFDLILWIKKTSNQDIFARAWLDGYEVKKEKLYTARLKINGKERDSYVNRVIESGEIYLSNLTSIEGKLQVHFTQTELKELHYWNNPAFEIEEVSNE